MEWKLFASIAGFAVVGISVAVSVLLDRERPGTREGSRDEGDSSAGEGEAAKLEGSLQEGYDHIVELGGGARALARDARRERDRAESAGGRAQDSSVEATDKGCDDRGTVGRALSRW